MPGRALFVSSSCAVLAAVGSARADFTVIALPDTQYYSAFNPEAYIQLTEWIRDQADTFNLQAVLHEGDIVNTPWAEEEWIAADIAMTILDDHVPYCLAVGNHDMGLTGWASDRDTTLYNKYFPYTRYEDKPWYGGHHGDDNDNHYIQFSEDGMSFLAFAFEFGPTEEHLQWASDVIDAHPTHRVMVVTHCYMHSDNTRVNADDPPSPHNYGIGLLDPPPNDGEEMWEKFVRKHENIFMVCSGHIACDFTGRLNSLNDFGKPCFQMLANYQCLPNWQNGWLRLLHFVPEEDVIHVTTYSPFLDDWKTDDENQFDLAYEMEDDGPPPPPPPPANPADLDEDGDVDGADLGIQLGLWGECPDPCVADLNEDGLVDGADLGILLANWTNR